jgi:hypothetical protein
VRERDRAYDLGRTLDDTGYDTRVRFDLHLLSFRAKALLARILRQTMLRQYVWTQGNVDTLELVTLAACKAITQPDGRAMSTAS